MTDGRIGRSDRSVGSVGWSDRSVLTFLPDYACFSVPSLHYNTLYLTSRSPGMTHPALHRGTSGGGTALGTSRVLSPGYT